MIETERFILRPFTESDAEDVFEYLNEPLAHCFACMKLNTLDEAKAESVKKAKETEPGHRHISQPFGLYPDE